jgi:hypothetical protein
MASSKQPAVARLAVPLKKTPAEIRQQQASLLNAKKAFSNFSTGKPAAKKAGRNYVAPDQSVQGRQKEVITQQLADLKPVGPGLTILASPDTLKLEDGKMELSVIITAMEKAKKGFVFYTDGSTLTEQINIQTQAEQIIAAIRQAGPQNG